MNEHRENEGCCNDSIDGELNRIAMGLKHHRILVSGCIEDIHREPRQDMLLCRWMFLILSQSIIIGGNLAMFSGGRIG